AGVAAGVAAGVVAAAERAGGNGPGLLLRRAGGLARGARRPGPGLGRHDEGAVAAGPGPAGGRPRGALLGPRRQVQRRWGAARGAAPPRPRPPPPGRPPPPAGGAGGRAVLASVATRPAR